MCKSKQTFINRRSRIYGPEGVSLKAIELITKTKIIIQGSTVAIVGSENGVNRASEIITDGMKNNVHPVMNIKVFFSFSYSSKLEFPSLIRLYAIAPKIIPNKFLRTLVLNQFTEM